MNVRIGGQASLFRALGRSRRGSASALVFLGYLALAFLFLGLRVVQHPESTIIGDRYADPQLFVWSFAWWPHAILNGENPFYTHAIWAPSGVDLAWTTSVPALAIAFAPLTLAFNAIMSYDVACIVLAALGAWAAFLLCRHITRTLWPSLVGGYLFGFSSYVLGGELDHIHTVAVFVLPLVALLVLRFLEGDLGARAFTIETGALLGLQAYLSTEILLTLTLALATAIILTVALAPGLRRRVASAVGPLVGAYAIGAALAAPIAYYTLTSYGSRPPPGAENYVTDALNFVVPTMISFGGWWSGGLAAHFPGNDVERGAYLGVPTLAIVCWFALTRWRTAAGRFLVAAFAIGAIASLGSWLTVDGRRVVGLPWLHLADRPLFDDLLPARLSVYTSLAAAVIVTLWAASRVVPVWIRVALCGLAVLAVAPNLALQEWAKRPRVPVLFTSTLARRCLSEGENVLAFPYGPRGDTMLWQVDSDFWFRIAGGYIAPSPPTQFSRPPSVQRIAADDLPPKVTTQSIRLFVRLKGVGAIVLDARQEPFWKPLLAPLAKPQAVGGVLIYRLTANAHGCDSDLGR